jgi:DNA-directed RNA polymerase subunit RPC12/RpoP
MSNMPNIPKLVGGPPVFVTESVFFSLKCPKCKKLLDVTSLKYGTNIECPNCSNLTWVPELKPRWWFKARNFVMSNIVSLLVGILSSLAGSWLWENSKTKAPMDGVAIKQGVINHGD